MAKKSGKSADGKGTTALVDLYGKNCYPGRQKRNILMKLPSQDKISGTSKSGTGTAALIDLP
jgi:hypothetical protein